MFSPSNVAQQEKRAAAAADDGGGDGGDDLPFGDPFTDSLLRLEAKLSGALAVEQERRPADGGAAAKSGRPRRLRRAGGALSRWARRWLLRGGDRGRAGPDEAAPDGPRKAVAEAITASYYYEYYYY